MLFNSWIFLCFFTLVLVAYWRLQHKWQNRFLLLASYVFYCAWDWRFLGLILFSTAVDFFAARAMENRGDSRRRALLIASLVSNLGLLAFFKYFNFFVESASAFLSHLGLESHPDILRIILPVGISFYTFQSLSYTVDCYRKQIKAETSFVRFGLYVAFFPQLVAGPIERAGRLLARIQAPRVLARNQVYEGLWLILLGFFKKVVIADNLATVVQSVYGQSDATDCIGVFVGTYAFALQIYGDFSGYTDIARGCAKLLGFELMQNFALPYMARSPSEFWARWHISLSTWIRDYLYIPLGGNRFGRTRTCINLLLTMALAGLWHGAAWTFVVWGLFHGVLLVLYRVLKLDAAVARAGRGAAWLWRIVMFHLVCFGWVLFRISDLHDLRVFVWHISTLKFNGVTEAAGLIFPLLFFGALLAAVEAITHSSDRPDQARSWRWSGPIVVGGMVLALLVCGAPRSESFIYFQF
jgi:alginate O-acetyltransferase complex protein AlgI